MPVFQKDLADKSGEGLLLYVPGFWTKRSKFLTGLSKMAKAAIGKAVKAAL